MFTGAIDFGVRNMTAAVWQLGKFGLNNNGVL
jgi:hypothetical protein